MIFQGGGSLGAYGAGAYRGLYELLSKKDSYEGKKGKPVFNIFGGTLIGEINAAILVSYVIENQTFEGSAERLIEFWNYLSKESIVESNPFLCHGGVTGIVLIESSRLEKLRDDTIRPKNLQYVGHERNNY